MDYKVNERSGGSKKLRLFNIFLSVLLIAVIGFIGFKLLFEPETVEEKIANQITFDKSLSESDIFLIEQSITEKNIEINSPLTISGVLKTEVEEADDILSIYIPVTNVYSVKQSTNNDELKTNSFSASETLPIQDKELLAGYFEIEAIDIGNILENESELTDEEVSFIPISALTYKEKLLEFNDAYYLDDFKSGALFKVAVYDGDGVADLNSLELKGELNSERIYKVNMTGVTALTRELQKKLSVVKDPLYFSANIGEFLADADLTHVSNEVSFLENCSYSYTLFCSPPEFIETLKASGVDLVELTGNHNNDLGAQANADTINLYKELGWATVGGGLNSTEASKPYIADEEGSKIAFLAYNYPDSPNGGAIAGIDKAGANAFDFSFESIKTDIESAKQISDFVIVNIQYWECYSYPNGYIEYPICDKPIDNQEETFKKMVDLGADMVVGSSAHQPQTYEIYDGKPIYYGLGNLYFEQTQWPGTERGIVLTHYFKDGYLLQTKLTPTVFDRDLQTRLMSDEEASYLLTRLRDARL